MVENGNTETWLKVKQIFLEFIGPYAVIILLKNTFFPLVYITFTPLKLLSLSLNNVLKIIIKTCKYERPCVDCGS